MEIFSPKEKGGQVTPVDYCIKSPQFAAQHMRVTDALPQPWIIANWIQAYALIVGLRDDVQGMIAL